MQSIISQITETTTDDSDTISDTSLDSWVSFPQITYDKKIWRVFVWEIIYAG